MSFFASPRNLAEILLPDGFPVPSVEPSRKVRKLTIGETHALVLCRPDPEKARGNLHRQVFVRRDIRCETRKRILGHRLEV